MLQSHLFYYYFVFFFCSPTARIQFDKLSIASAPNPLHYIKEKQTNIIPHRPKLLPRKSFEFWCYSNLNNHDSTILSCQPTHHLWSSHHVVFGICGIHSSDVCFHAVRARCIWSEKLARPGISRTGTDLTLKANLISVAANICGGGGRVVEVDLPGTRAGRAGSTGSTRRRFFGSFARAWVCE